MFDEGYARTVRRSIGAGCMQQPSYAPIRSGTQKEQPDA